MSLNEQFIPGQWVDTIDVNDFVNLNKKPFLSEPIFLKNTMNEQTEEYFLQVKQFLKEHKLEVEPSFPFLEQEDIPWLTSDISKDSFKRKIGYSENIQEMKTFYGIPSKGIRSESRKTTYQLFDEVVTSDANKMMKIHLFTGIPATYSPSFIHPDVRIVALYGTKQLLKEKRWALKSLEKHLQTHEWMQRRISIHREIEAIKQFELFAKRQGVDVSNPAESAREASLFIYLTIAGAMMENPSIPFSLHHVIPFLDIYIEHDLQSNSITEEEAQDIIHTFYLRLAFIRFSLSPGLVKGHERFPFFFGESFGGEYVTKTTFRFLFSMKLFQLFPFSIRILWNEMLPDPFVAFIQELIEEEIPISFYAHHTYQRKNSIGFYPYGLHGSPSEDVLYDAGGCDLLKLFYLTLNGGKEAEQNVNLVAITQPFRQNELHYDEVMNKLKDFLSYVLSSYVEIMNTVLYLNDVHNNHPFRSSLMSYMLYYHVQFGFFHVEKLAQLLSAIYADHYTVIRDKKGWITEVVPGEDVRSDEMMITILAEMIQLEIGKIPIYKSGKPHVKFYLGGMTETWDEKSIKEKQVIPSEMTPIIFPANIQIQEKKQLPALLKEQFDKGFREIHVYINNEWVMINGVLYVEEGNEK